MNLPWAKEVDIVAFTIDNVLTKEECDEWVAETEAQGYEVAAVNVGYKEIIDQDYRKSKRCIVDSTEKADWLWDKIKAGFIFGGYLGRGVVTGLL